MNSEYHSGASADRHCHSTAACYCGVIGSSMSRITQHMKQGGLGLKICWCDFLKQQGKFGKEKRMSNAQKPSVTVHKPAAAAAANGQLPWCEHVLYKASEWRKKQCLQLLFNNNNKNNVFQKLHLCGNAMQPSQSYKLKWNKICQRVV